MGEKVEMYITSSIYIQLHLNWWAGDSRAALGLKGCRLNSWLANNLSSLDAIGIVGILSKA
jgi:hypothetical protein